MLVTLEHLKLAPNSRAKFKNKERTFALELEGASNGGGVTAGTVRGGSAAAAARVCAPCAFRSTCGAAKAQ
ncbi:hypothetical protein [Phenylobacterium sp.]|uniref:hypothetical protein n=1 Tax=Phenylobacterium sp. TaxID=1871053 RepID=UPI0035B11189